MLRPSHKKQKDSLEGSLDEVLFAAELVLPKVLVTKPPQNTSNVYIKSGGKPKHCYSLCDQPYSALMCLFYCFDIAFSIDFSPSEQCNI